MGGTRSRASADGKVLLPSNTHSHLSPCDRVRLVGWGLPHHSKPAPLPAFQSLRFLERLPPMSFPRRRESLETAIAPRTGGASPTLQASEVVRASVIQLILLIPSKNPKHPSASIPAPNTSGAGGPPARRAPAPAPVPISRHDTLHSRGYPGENGADVTLRGRPGKGDSCEGRHS